MPAAGGRRKAWKAPEAGCGLRAAFPAVPIKILPPINASNVTAALSRVPETSPKLDTGQFNAACARAARVLSGEGWPGHDGGAEPVSGSAAGCAGADTG